MSLFYKFHEFYAAIEPLTVQQYIKYKFGTTDFKINRDSSNFEYRNQLILIIPRVMRVFNYCHHTNACDRD